MKERAVLGIDGNYGCALLGENLQEGEVEFVEIVCNEPQWTKAWRQAAWAACWSAYLKLKARLPNRKFSYAWDRHPLYD